MLLSGACSLSFLLVVSIEHDTCFRLDFLLASLSFALDSQHSTEQSVVEENSAYRTSVNTFRRPDILIGDTGKSG